MSGVGKGIATSSMGLLLENAGYNVNCLKIDPYLNIDAGMFNPIEHGETFVLSSGLETDQDMGNYERFLNKNLNASDYLTSGMLYKEVLDKERAFYYKGKTVEAVPHITTAIRERIEASAKDSKADIQLIEIGGTLGDFQNELFIEAARFMKLKDKENVSFVLVSYLPKPFTLGEVKTRPTQHAIQLLNSYGINPDLIIARSEKELTEDKRKKIANSCGLDIEQIISAPDISNIYNTPGNFYKNKVDDTLLKILKLKKKNKKETIIKNWINITDKISNTKLKKIKVAIVGKYGFSTDGLLKDAYLSVSEAIKFSCAKNNLYPEIDYVYSGNFEKSNNKVSDFKKYNAVIIAGGFGENGINGKINIMKYLRENNIPTLGICYGLQLMAVELSRNILKRKDANTTEINPNTKYPIVDIQLDQKEKVKNAKYGGTMRLGDYTGNIIKNSKLYSIYKQKQIIERHRHRYEINNQFINDLKSIGFNPVMLSDSGLVEACEYNKNDFYIGVQFHPEFLARPLSTAPLFDALIKAGLKKRK